MKAILPVAGLGTRFLPATKAQPKEMLTIVDRPVIQYIVEEVVASGIKEIILVTSQSKRAIEDYFDRSFELEHYLAKAGKKEALKEVRRISELANFYYVRQKEMAGNGDAILCAKNLIGDEPCAVLFSDDVIDSQIPCLKQMIKVFEKYGDPVIAVEKVSKKDIQRYGVVEVVKLEKKVHQVKKIVEKPKPDEVPSNLGVVGRYIITPEVLGALEILGPKIKGELGITDALQFLLKNNRPIYAYEFDGLRFDCGNKLGLIKAIFHYSQKHPEISRILKNFLDKKSV
ncbi:MAG: UTP--glucose-1-phosphate uridylyltransferase GalU [Patescibacteria group bacterium]